MTDAKNFLEMVEMINGDLKKKEWKTDRYNLSRGWLERALCMCLAIAYPAQLRNALSSQERKKLPNPLFCELYLTIVNGSKDL